MADITTEIRSEVDSFVNKLSGLVRRAALEAVTQALGEGRAPAARKPAVKAPAPQRAAPAKAAPKAAAKRLLAKRAKLAAKARPVGAKRPPEEIDRLTARVEKYIRENPGRGVEGIGKALNAPTKDLTLPIKRLLNEKKITSKGERRATKYFPR